MASESKLPSHHIVARSYLIGRRAHAPKCRSGYVCTYIQYCIGYQEQRTIPGVRAAICRYDNDVKEGPLINTSRRGDSVCMIKGGKGQGAWERGSYIPL